MGPSTPTASSGRASRTHYRTILPLSKSKFTKGHTYRLCVMAGAAETADEQFTPPPAGEVCQDVLVK